MQTKICSKCKINKSVDSFRTKVSSYVKSDGTKSVSYRSRCKQCEVKDRQSPRHKESERRRMERFKKNHPEKVKANKKRYYKRHRQKLLEKTSGNRQKKKETTSYTCKTCGTTFGSYLKSPEFCSPKCVANSDEIRLKKEKTSLRKYKVSHPSSSERVSRKISNIRINNYLDSLFPEISQRLSSKEWLLEAHHAQKKTLDTIAKELGVSRSTVANFCRRLDIDILRFPNSQPERDIAEILQFLGVRVFTNIRDIFPDGQELDIWCPDQSLAIEYNGLYWHSEARLGRSYHAEKTRLANTLGIRLLHVMENEWLDPKKSLVWESIITNAVGKTDKIYARNTEIVEMSAKDKKKWFEQTHLQGNTQSKFALALEEKISGSIVAAISFREHRKYGWEIARMSSAPGTRVVGGASKLFKASVDHCKADTVLSYCDLRYGTGKVYEALGFKLDGTTNPNYRYFLKSDKQNTYSRQKFQKHKLKNLLEKFDPNLTEYENMLVNGYDRIWDSGNLRYIWSKEKNS